MSHTDTMFQGLDDSTDAEMCTDGGVCADTVCADTVCTDVAYSTDVWDSVDFTFRTVLTLKGFTDVWGQG